MLFNPDTNIALFLFSVTGRALLTKNIKILMKIIAPHFNFSFFFFLHSTSILLWFFSYAPQFVWKIMCKLKIIYINFIIYFNLTMSRSTVSLQGFLFIFSLFCIFNFLFLEFLLTILISSSEKYFGFSFRSSFIQTLVQTHQKKGYFWWIVYIVKYENDRFKEKMSFGVFITILTINSLVNLFDKDTFCFEKIYI